MARSPSNVGTCSNTSTGKCAHPGSSRGRPRSNGRSSPGTCSEPQPGPSAASTVTIARRKRDTVRLRPAVGVTSKASRQGAWGCGGGILMRRLLAIASVLVVSVFTTASATAARHGPAIANLTGTQEVISVGTSSVPGTSLATGLATFKLTEDGKALQYRLSVSHLTGIVGSHIHLNRAGVNGPVVVFLFNSAVPTGEVNGLLAQGTITAASFVNQLAGHPFSELLTVIRNGDAYVNVHTLPNHPGGEIRGRVLAAAEGEV